MSDTTTSRDLEHGDVSRRRFLAETTAGMLFTIVPRHVLGGPGYTAPSEKLNIAGVGIGGKGSSDLSSLGSENIVALCDVDWSHASHVFRRYPEARKYKDYRVLLEEEKDLDAVVTATPDHMHAPVSMTAIKAGKHVYCQKPLTHTVFEARAVADAARKYGVATQMGNQGQASERTRRICELVQSGAIGPVREAHVWTDRPLRGIRDVYWPQGVPRPRETPAVPKTLDWNLFLGPARERPYHPVYTPFKWRGWWDFGTGALGDIGCHALDPVFRALKLGAPTSVQACSTLVNTETFPVASRVEFEFPARGELPAVTLVWYDGGLRPPRPRELEHGAAMGTNGTLYVGDDGKILDGRLIPREKFRGFEVPPRTIPRSPGHYQEWLAHAKGGKPGGSSFDWAGPLTEAVLLGNVALRPELKDTLTRQKLEWDPKKFEITNLPEANRFLHFDYREGWSL